MHYPSLPLIRVDFGNDNYYGAIESGVFDLTLSEADVGQTYTISSGTEFDSAVEILTNGTNEYIHVEIWGYPYPHRGGRGSGRSVASYFFGDHTGANKIDFSGDGSHFLFARPSGMRLSS